MSIRFKVHRPLQLLAMVGLASSILAAGPAAALAQTTDQTGIYPATCELAIPSDLYNSDSSVTASIAQAQADCLNAVNSAPGVTTATTSSTTPAS